MPTTPVFDDPTFGEDIGTLVQNEDGAWEPALKADVSQRDLRESMVEFVMRR